MICFQLKEVAKYVTYELETMMLHITEVTKKKDISLKDRAIIKHCLYELFVLAYRYCNCSGMLAVPVTVLIKCN